MINERDPASVNNLNSNEIPVNEHGATCSPQIDDISTKSTANAQDGDVRCNDSEPNLKKAGRLKCNDTKCNADPKVAQTNASKPDSNVRHNDIGGVKKTKNDVANSNISSDTYDSNDTDMITTAKSQDGSVRHNDIDSVNTNNCDFVKPSDGSLCPGIPTSDVSVIVADGGDPDIASTDANAGCVAKCTDTAASCENGNNSSPLVTADDAETCDNHNDKDTTDKTAASCEKGNNSAPLLAADDAETRDNHNDKDTTDKTAASCEKGNISSPLLAEDDAETRDNHNDKDTTDKTVVEIASNPSELEEATDDRKRNPDNAASDTPRTKTPSLKCTNESTVVPSKEKQSGKPESFEVMRNIAGQIIMPSTNIPEHK